MSQRDTALEALRSAGERGACLADIAQLDPNMPYRYRNVISDLRKDGLPIVGERCVRHAHKGPILSYRLVPAGQQAMAL